MAYVNVDIDIEDIDWCDIVAHVEECGYCVIDKNDIQRIYDNKLYGKSEKTDKLINDLIYNTIGKTL